LTDNTQPSGLRHYVTVLWRRKWIVLQALILIPLAVVVISLIRPTLYAATARVMAVDQSSTLNVATGTNVDAQTLDERALETLASFVATREVARRAVERLSPSPDIDEVLDKVEAETDPNADVILITAEDADAGRSGEIANAFADAFVDWRRETQQRTLEEALQTVDQQIAASATGSYTRQLLVERRRQLEVLEVLMTGGVAVGEPAATPQSPASPKPIRDGALAFAAAIVIAIGLAFVREALDVSVHDVQELSSLTDLPIVGEIPGFRKDERASGKIIALDDPRGPTAEAYRFLRVNLGFVDFNHSVKSILVTSQLPQQGKSTTVANLAISLLRAGSKVAVVEGDLRRPALHRLFNVPNAKGVSSVVAGSTSLDDAVFQLSFATRQPHVATAGGSAEPQAAPELKLTLLTSGPLPPNPGEVVTSEQYSTIITQLEESHDFVLVDAPPMLLVGDAGTLAGKVDGVLIVVRLEQATRDSVTSIEDFVRRVPARTLGLVVTGVRRGTGSNSYKYDQYYD
jgi:receptor protein-tyrosine kinase